MAVTIDTSTTRLFLHHHHHHHVNPFLILLLTVIIHSTIVVNAIPHHHHQQLVSTTPNNINSILLPPSLSSLTSSSRFRSGCRDNPAGVAPRCSERYELHDPSHSATFIAYPPITVLVDNGHARFVEFTVTCGPKTHTISAAPFSCHGYDFAPGPVPCVVNSQSGHWIGVYACVADMYGKDEK